MPYVIEHRTGARPWKIVNEDTGKIVGSSKTRRAAQKSVNARRASEHNWKGSKS